MDNRNGTPFSATGKGYVNDIARIAADEITATAKLENTALAQHDPNREIFLWIVEVTTGYSLSLETGQGQRGRAHYPRHIQQEDIQIQGITASQHQKDLVVQFISHSQQTVFDTNNKGATQQNHFGHLIFTLYPGNYDTLNVGNGTSKVIHYEPWKYKVQATSIDAGHERFQFAPGYTLSLLVIDDLLQENVEVQYDLMKRLNKNYKANLFNGNIASGGTYGTTPAVQASSITRNATQDFQSAIENVPSVFDQNTE